MRPERHVIVYIRAADVLLVTRAGSLITSGSAQEVWLFMAARNTIVHTRQDTRAHFRSAIIQDAITWRFLWRSFI